MINPPLRSLALLAALVFPAAAAEAQRLPTEIRTPDYVMAVDVVARDLRTPWGIAFINATTAIVTEKPGPVRLLDLKTGTLSEPIAGTPEVVDAGQGGMLDVAVDPEYDKEPWVYLSYSHRNPVEGGRGAMTRIVRGKIVDGRWVDQQVLFEARPEHYTTGGNHFGCRIVFDDAGHLYFCIGERGRQDDAQVLSRPNGKVHRINRDGSIPADNPFVGRDDAYPSIFSYGNRNQQGMAIHPETDQLWATEHGPRGGDELNLIQSGRNYGWPVITYGINYNGTKVSDLTHKEGMEQPVIQWTPSIAACGLAFYQGDEFPRWQNHLLAGALAFQELRLIKLDGEKSASDQILLKGMGRIRDVKVGPDGAIYLALNAPDVIVRLTRK